MVISDHSEYRSVFVDEHFPDDWFNMTPDQCLESIEDDSSWERFDETIEQLTDGTLILAERELPWDM